MGAKTSALFYSPSFNGIAECAGVVTDTEVARDDRYKGGRLAQCFDSRQVNGVQSSDRLDRKGAASPGKDRLSDTHDVATPMKPRKGEQGCPLLLSRDPSPEARAKNGATGFGKRDRRCDTLSLGANRGSRGRVTLQKGRNQRAGFDVAPVRHPLGGRRTDWPAGRNRFTLRHDRCQSGRLPSPEGAEFQGSLPEGRHSRRVA